MEAGSCCRAGKSRPAGRPRAAQRGLRLLKDGEAFLFGAHISPLTTASTHVVPDPVRTRKLLLNRRELSAHRRGGTHGLYARPLELYWKNGRAKLKIGLAKGKKQHDKRAPEGPRLAARQVPVDETQREMRKAVGARL